MPSSYKIIKNHQVDFGIEDFEIPVVPADHLADGEQDVLKYKIEKEQQARLINNAKAQAQEILQEARDAAEQIKKEAYTQGHREGFAQGEAEGERKAFERTEIETSRLKEQAREFLHEAHQRSRDYIHRTREEIIELSVSMAGSIVHHHIHLQEENMVDMVHNALKQAEGKKQILIRCSSEYTLLMETKLHQFVKICPNAVFTIIEDNTLDDPGCMIETEDQVFNLDIDLQLADMKKTLLEMVNENED